MAQQAMLFEIITGMKKVTARHDDASDSDDSIRRVTNRGNKLKRKAKHVQEGHLAQADGPKVYKRRLNYNGYTRNVISRNVPKVDPDGDQIDDDDHSDPDLSPAEDDPYSDVKLESLLMPLTSAADLDKHPSLSIPYTSKVLEEMVKNAQDMVHREEAALWRVKQLLVQFRGDDRYAPCGLFETDGDASLLQGLRAYPSMAPSVDLDAGKSAAESAAWETMSHVPLVQSVDDAAELASNAYAPSVAADNQDNAEEIAQTRPLDMAIPGETNGNGTNADDAQDPMQLDKRSEADTAQDATSADARSAKDLLRPKQEPTEPVPIAESPNLVPATNDVSTGEADQRAGDHTTAPQNLNPDGFAQPAGLNREKTAQITGDAPEANEADPETKSKPDDDASEADQSSQTYRMTTRARAQANPASGSSASLQMQHDADTIPAIHPFFSVPTDSLPFRSQGLSPQLSDDVRLALSAYTQRQEEVVRQCNTLLAGLRKALHMKRTVWNWCRNEGHIGEMSDGEDWVDMEEWDLDEPLKKGEEVEDEEVAVGLTKKTRNRRAAA